MTDRHDSDETLTGDAYAPRGSRFAVGVTVADRYRLDSELGKGGGGQVFKALDLDSDSEVALKVLLGHSEKDLHRVRREIRALRTLRNPGVVELLDEGTADATPYIVMQVIDGTRFPGDDTPRTWSGISKTVYALLETLGRIHAAGVVHRDLKPSNVLVDRAGVPTVLDFGLALGYDLGTRVTSDQLVVGTPYYLAPEQIGRNEIDLRTDLYAIGVMLYECLAGRFPHSGANMLHAKSSRPKSLSEVAPQVPPHVALLVDSLLDPDPDRRPASAGRVLSLLEHSATQAKSHEFPFLGPTTVLDEMESAILQRRSLDLVGSPGMGRSRLLYEASRLAEKHGFSPFAIQARSQAPLSGIAPLVESEKLSTLHVDDALKEARAVVVSKLEEGTVLLIDDAEDLDRWTVKVLEACQPHGAILRTVTERTSQSVELEPLSQEDLRPLFRGPDRLFHLQEDGARELFRRTEGVPQRVVNEINSWHRAGLIDWRDGKVQLDRNNLGKIRSSIAVGEGQFRLDPSAHGIDPFLDEVLAMVHLCAPHGTIELLAAISDQARWRIEAAIEELEAMEAVVAHHGSLKPRLASNRMHAWSLSDRADIHNRISAALPVGTPGRLQHLLLGGPVEQVADEAVLVAREFSSVGRADDAIAILGETMTMMRTDGVHEYDERLLIEWARVVFSLANRQEYKRLLREIDRSLASSAVLENLRSLAQITLLGMARSTAELLSRIDALPPFEDEHLQRWVQVSRLRIARGISPEEEQRAMDRARKWSEECGLAGARTAIASWEGILRYRQHQFLEAAELHLRAAEAADTARSKLASMGNAASAFCDAYDFPSARRVATDIVELALEMRDPGYEAHGETILRICSYRALEDLEPDLSLTEAVVHLGRPDLEAPTLLNEAAVSWRAGDLDTGQRLASAAAERFRRLGFEWGIRLCRVTAALCGETLESTEALALCEGVDECPVPGVAIQVLGGLQLNDHHVDLNLSQKIRMLSDQFPRETWRFRREVFSVDELLST